MSIKNLKQRKIQLSEFRLILLLGTAIFSAEFLIISVMKVSSLNLFSSVPLYILHNFGILILVVSPLLLLLPSFTESKNRLEKLYHVLKSVRKVNEFINKESNSDRILNKACDILMESGEYKSVTIYNSRLEKVTESGIKFVEKTPPCVHHSLNRGRWVLNNEENGCSSCILDDETHCLVLPFNTQDGVILMLIHKEIEFEREEIKLLEEIAGDISFALVKNKADKELRESEEKYRLLADNVRDVIWTMDMNLRLDYISPSVEYITGYSVEEIMELPLENLLLPESFETTMNVLEEEKTRKTKDKNYNMSRELELGIYCKDGSTIWTESRVTFLNKEGDIEVLGVTRDISERKAAENRLHETKERLRGIFDSSPDAIVVTDLMGNILECNPATVKIHGYSEKEELIGKNSFDFIAEEDQERAAKNMESTLKEGCLRNVEYSFLTKDRARFPAELSVSTIKDSSGIPIAFVGIIKNIEQRKRAEEKLKKSEEEYRTTFEHTGTAMLIIEEDTTVSMVNEEFEKLSGYSREELEGKRSWTEFVHPQELEWMRKYHVERREGKEVPKKYEFRAIDREGNFRNVLLTIEMLPDTKKSICSMTDITSIKRLNNLLKVTTRINELVAREKSPDVVLEAVCENLGLLYDGVFTALGSNIENLEPVQLKDVDPQSIEQSIRTCPSIKEAIRGNVEKLRVGREICGNCIKNPQKYVLSIPLIRTRLYGIITVHSDFDFDQEEIDLLEKLASNIAFALSAYEIEKERTRALEQLAENLTQFDKSADRLRNPLAVIMNSLELTNELSNDKIFEIIDQQVTRIKNELDELRDEEIKTFELTEGLQK